MITKNYKILKSQQASITKWKNEFVSLDTSEERKRAIMANVHKKVNLLDEKYNECLLKDDLTNLNDLTQLYD